MERTGFLLLGESPGHEIVFSTVVQPWKAVTDDEPAPQAEPGRFAAFDTPGYVKVAFNIRVEPYGSGRALITTETRTAATDPTSLRRFTRYWLLVGPFSALIRRLMLRIVKSDAERRPGLTSNTRPPGAWPGGPPGAGSGDDLTPPETADHCPHRTPASNVGLSGGGGNAVRRLGATRRGDSATLGHRLRCPCQHAWWSAGRGCPDRSDVAAAQVTLLGPLRPAGRIAAAGCRSRSVRSPR